MKIIMYVPPFAGEARPSHTTDDGKGPLGRNSGGEAAGQGRGLLTPTSQLSAEPGFFKRRAKQFKNIFNEGWELCTYSVFA